MSEVFKKVVTIGSKYLQTYFAQIAVSLRVFFNFLCKLKFDQIYIEGNTLNY